MSEIISKSKLLTTSGLASRLILWLVAALAASGAQAQTTVEYIHTDALGSPVAVTDASGNVIERSEYAPYGELLNRPLTDGPGYTGHVQDASTGLTYMQQRYYDQGIGRFLSVDPVTVDGSTGDNFNRYWYANNNPYTFFDPDGRCTGSHIKNTDGTCVSTSEHTATPTAASGGLTNSTGGTQSSSSSAFSRLTSYFSERNWLTGTGSLTDFEALGDDLRPALEMPQLGGGSFKIASSIFLFRLGKVGAGAQGFQSFNAFKRAFGPAGVGRHWHHIVEQTPGNVARFGPQSIHSTQNLVKLDAAVHGRISGFYSSIQPQVTGSSAMTVRQWLSTQPFQAQQAFGQQVLKQFGGQ